MRRSGGSLALIGVAVVAAICGLGILAGFAGAELGWYNAWYCVMFVGAGLVFAVLFLLIRKAAIWTVSNQAGSGYTTPGDGSRYVTAAAIMVTVGIALYILAVLKDRTFIFVLAGALGLPFICLFAYFLVKYSSGVTQGPEIVVNTRYPENRTAAILMLVLCCIGVFVLFLILTVPIYVLFFTDDLQGYDPWEITFYAGAPLAMIILLWLVPMLASRTVMISESRAASASGTRYIAAAVIIAVLCEAMVVCLIYGIGPRIDHPYYYTGTHVFVVPFMVAYGILAAKFGVGVSGSRGAYPGASGVTPVSAPPYGAAPVSAPPYGAAPPQGKPAGKLPIEGMQELKELCEAGIITEEEYRAKVRELLDLK